MGLGQIWYQIWNKAYRILKVSNFTSNKYVYVNRLESFFFEYVSTYFTEQNLIQRGDPIEFNFEGLEVKQTKG